MHLIFLPFAIVVAAVLIEELASSMPESVLFKSFVATTGFILLNDELDVGLVIFILGLGRLVGGFFVYLNDSRIVLVRISHRRRRSGLIYSDGSAHQLWLSLGGVWNRR